MTQDHQQILDAIILWSPYVITAVSLLFAFARELKAGKTLQEAVMLVANTLKDEAKMADGKFSDATIAKVEKVAEVIKAGDDAKKAVTSALSNGEHTNDIKVGSLGGRPIYIGQVVTTGAALLEFWRRIKGEKK